MRIAEIFYSLQGEGELAGMPSVFIRTSGCNLRCVWCDTPYASWYPEGNSLAPKQILEHVLQFPTTYCVLTGGEPMLSNEIHQLAALLQEAGRHITIETAATLPPKGIPCHLASLSPKLANSTPPSSLGSWHRIHEKRRVKLEVIRQWIEAYPYQLKFVVASEHDAYQAITFCSQHLPEVPRSKIFLMPEARTQESLASLDWLVNFCKQTGCRFCDRLHLRLFGNHRGT